MKITVQNTTSPGVAVDVGTFGLLAAGATQSLTITAAVWETMAGMINSLTTSGYITYTVAADTVVSASEQTVSAGLGGQLASKWQTIATSGLASGATIGTSSTTFYVSGASPTGAYATGAAGKPFYLSSGAYNGITAGLSFQNAAYKSMLVLQATGATVAGGNITVFSDNSPVPTVAVAQETIVPGTQFMTVPIQPGANVLITLTAPGGTLGSATLYTVNS